jgi:hypothetical protein
MNSFSIIVSFKNYTCITPKLNFSVMGEWFAASIPVEIQFLVSKGLIIASTQILAAEYSA